MMNLYLLFHAVAFRLPNPKLHKTPPATNKADSSSTDVDVLY